MTDRIESPEENQEPIECGTFESWADAVKTIEKLVKSDQPEFIAPVSEEEFKNGNYFASSINAVPPAILKDMLESLYPAQKIKVSLQELNIGGRRVKQIIAVYS